MKVSLKFFLPSVPEIVGSKQLEVEFDGQSIDELIDHLVARYGSQIERALYSDDGKLDPVIQVLRNGEAWINREQLETVLQDGDDLIFMMMMAGG